MRGGKAVAPPPMMEGVVYEFIAIPCGHRYTTPLGLRWGSKPEAKVYSATRLYYILRSGVGKLILYSPVNPADFIESILHTLDEDLSEGCEPPRPYTIAYRCRPEIIYSDDELMSIACEDGELFEGRPAPYTRLYGAIIEALVVASKAGAGVLDEDEAASCMSCALWAARRAGRERFMAVQEMLHAAIRRLQGSSDILASLHEDDRAPNGVSEMARGGAGGRGRRKR